jgi:mannosyltransferase
LRTRPEVVAVAALTALALALRASQLGQSLFFDELYAFDEVAHRSFAGMLSAVRTGPELNPPLFFAFAWLSARIGDPTVWLRLPSLVCGVALVPATYALGAISVGRRAALVASGVTVLAPFAIFYSVEARPYAMLVLLTVVSTICLLRALEAATGWWWVAYAAVSAAAVYTHYTAVVALVPQAIWAAVAHRSRLPRLAAANLAAVLLFAPWAPTVLAGRKPDVLAVYGPFTASPRVLASALVHMLPGFPFGSLARVPGLPAVVAWFAGLALAIGGALRAPRRPAERAPAAPALLVLGLGPAALATLLAVSALAGHNLFSSRNAITAFPYLALLVGWLLARSSLRPALAGGLLMLGSLIVGTVGAVAGDGRRPRYREAARIVEAQARPGDVVLHRSFALDSVLATELTLYLSPRIAYVRERFGDERAWAAARRGGRVFYVQVTPPPADDSRQPPQTRRRVEQLRRVPATLGPDRLVAVGRRRLAGIFPVWVSVYRHPRDRSQRSRAGR